MQNIPNNDLNPEEDIKASNQILRLKLELEHGMISGDTSHLSPEMENLWLNSVYNFERQYRREASAKVFDLLGRPSFPAADTLTEPEIHIQLEKVTALMSEKQIALDVCCDYADRVIYKFITEELFHHETDMIFMDGMVLHFIYEEFHPNHEHDLKRKSEDFINSVLTKTWDEDFHAYSVEKVVVFNQKEFSRETISSIIVAFQQSHNGFKVEEINITSVDFDLGKNSGHVEAQLKYVANPREGKKREFEGSCRFEFAYDEGWGIKEFVLPGFSSPAN